MRTSVPIFICIQNRHPTSQLGHRCFERWHKLLMFFIAQLNDLHLIEIWERLVWLISAFKKQLYSILNSMNTRKVNGRLRRNNLFGLGGFGKTRFVLLVTQNSTRRGLLVVIRTFCHLFGVTCGGHPKLVWLGFPGDASDKDPTCLCRRCKSCRFDPWVGKIPWSRKWQPTPVFLPGKSHGQRSLVGYSPWGCKETWLSTHTQLWWLVVAILLPSSAGTE